jgi:hypothetical protein
MKRVSPLGALFRGLLAGAAGTAAMTAYQELVQSDSSNAEKPKGDEEQVARRILNGVFETDVPTENIPLLANVAHWLYGTTLGTIYALVQAGRANPVAHGAPLRSRHLGIVVRGARPDGHLRAPVGVPAKTLATDLSYHLVYGLGVATAYERLQRIGW